MSTRRHIAAHGAIRIRCEPARNFGHPLRSLSFVFIEFGHISEAINRSAESQCVRLLIKRRKTDVQTSHSHRSHHERTALLFGSGGLILDLYSKEGDFHSRAYTLFSSAFRIDGNSVFFFVRFGFFSAHAAVSFVCFSTRFKSRLPHFALRFVCAA